MWEMILGFLCKPPDNNLIIYYFLFYCKPKENPSADGDSVVYTFYRNMKILVENSKK
jgi:hypothetical protein